MALRPDPIETSVERPFNLLSFPPLKAFLKSAWFPAILAYPTLVVFTYIIYALLWGPEVPAANLGTSLTWVLWWPLLPIFLFVAGRFWCAICPFATTIDLVQKVAGLGRPVPPFLKNYGIWIIDAVFILITWSDHVFGIVESPRGSGYLLGAMVTAVVVAGVLYERRTWCRYLCFLGGMSGNYSRSSAIELRATPEVCATCKTLSCYKGNDTTPGCPVFEFPRTMQTSSICNLCANCLKTCPNDSIRLTPRPPTKELWFMSRHKFEESFLAVVIVGIVLVQNITMLSFWEPSLVWLTNILFGSRTLAFTAIFLAAMGLPFAITAAAARLSGRSAGEGFRKNFSRFGYAIIPLDLAGHVAHNLFHLLAEGKSVFYNTAALFGVPVAGSKAILSAGAIQVLQFIILAVGIAGALYTAYRISAHNQQVRGRVQSFLPHMAVLLLFGALNVYLFTLPMVHRV